MSQERNLSVVIIDDDPAMSRWFGTRSRKILPGQGDRSFNTGEDALAGIVDEPDIAVLDYQLDTIKPDAMNGIQVLSKLKARYSDLPVIFLTGRIVLKWHRTR